MNPARLLILAAACALLAPSAAHAQVDRATLARIWQDPTFQRKLIGSYGIHSDIEPVLSELQQEYYEKVVAAIPNDPTGAARFLREILDDETAGKDAGSAIFDFTLGNLYFQNGRLPQAANSFTLAIRKFPDFRRAHQNLGIIYLQSDRPDQAIQHLSRTIALGGGDGPIFGLLGSAYAMSEKWPQAETAFRSAMILQPDSRDWKLGIVRSLFAQERFNDTAALVQMMLADTPEDRDLWGLLASAHLGAEDFASAIADYESIDLLGISTPESLNTLGDIYANQGVLAAAADAYLRAYRLAPDAGPAAPIRAAEILLAREGVNEATSLIENVASISGQALAPEDALRVKKLRARLLRTKGDDEAAAVLLRELVDQDPLDGDSILQLARHYQDHQPEPDGQGSEDEQAERVQATITENRQRAIHLYERAARIPEFEADASVRHAQLLVQMGRFQDAPPLLRRAQEINPRDSVARFLDDLDRYLKGRR